MPTAIALRSFDHNGKFAKGDTVTFDRITLDALRRARLVGPEVTDAPAKPSAPVKAPVPTAGKLGKKSAASPVAPASQPATLPPSTPGDLPPPIPGA